MNPNISYAVSVNKGSNSFSSYLNTPINGPLSTNQYPGIIPKSFLGVLPTINQTPQQFYPSQAPPYANEKTNMRFQYRRTAVSTPQRAQQYIAAKKSNPNAYWTPSTGNAFATSSHTNYIPPMPSSMFVNVKKSVAVGKSSYGVGLPTNTPVSTKNYFPTEVRTHLRRVRNGGTVAPKKKGAIINHGLYNTTVDIYPPGAPYIYNYVVTDLYIFIYFIQGSNGGSPITNYQYSVNGGQTFTNVSPEQTSNPIRIDNIYSGTINIELRAINAVGVGPVSNEIEISVSPLGFTYRFTNVNNISDEDILTYLPIINNNGLFTFLDTTITHGTGNTVIVSTVFEYVSNPLIPNQVIDGLTFYPNSSYYNTNMQDLNITSFGGIPLAKQLNTSTLEARQFSELTNLTISATDAPTILSNTSFKFIFLGCTNFNSNINNWDTSNVINLDAAFESCAVFNQPLNNWNVTNVTSMDSVFNLAESFNQNIESWDISNVTSIRNMFRGCLSFNQPLNNWDVSNVTNMLGVFQNATSFNQSINNWDVSNVTTMENLFNGATSFNEDISLWITSSLTNTVRMFSFSNFNQELNFMDVSNVTNMLRMFDSNPVFNQNLNNWVTSNVVNIIGIFANATSFNSDISTWDVSNVTSFNQLFYGATSFNSNINLWNTSNVTNMSAVFFDCYTFDQSLNNWDTSNVTTMESLFDGCFLFNQPLNNWNTSNVTNMRRIFTNANSFNSDITTWTTTNVTNMSVAFFNCYVFDQSLNGWDTSSVTNMDSMFLGCSSFNQSLSNWDTQSVTNMSNMFRNATSFNQSIDTWNVSNVVSMESMFYGCSSFNQPLNSWDTSSVTNMNSIFLGCSLFNQPLSNWNTSSVTNMENMFNGASSFNQNITYDASGNTWDTSNVIIMDNIFNDTLAFNNGETANVGTTSPLGWITQPLSGVTLPIPGNFTNCGLTDSNAANYNNISIITGLPPI